MDLVTARDFSIELSKTAGEILKKYFTSQNFTQQEKGTAGDIVTQADTEIDEFIRKKLSEKFPGIHIMSEETTSGDYRSLKNNEWIFIVDPLDGTINFARNIPHFGVSIALLNKGKIKMCVAHLPMQDETYWADDETEGAYVNDKQIAVSSVDVITKAVIACGFSNSKEARTKMLKILEGFVQETSKIKCLGSPVADLCLVAKGDLDAYIHPRLRPWDITPAYIVQKAGGKVSNFNQKDWDIFRLDLVAGNATIYEKLSKMIPFDSYTEIK